MLEDVGDAFGRFVEIDGDGDAASAGDGEVGGVPLGAIGGEEADAVAGLYAKFDECRGESCDAAQEFFGGDRLPAIGGTEHLCARIRQRVDSVEQSRGKGAVVHERL